MSTFAIAGPAAAASPTRLAGVNRYDTARVLSASLNQCILGVANGHQFPDGLAGAVLGVPILLTETDSLPDETLIELERLDASCPGGIQGIFVLGGPAAVSAQIFQKLLVDFAPGAVIRLSGATRYETALAIAQYVQGNGGISDDTVFLATGADFPDALAAGPVSDTRRYPILLNEGASLRPEVLDFLQLENITDVLILGGNAAIPQSVEDELQLLGMSTERFAGADRVGTAVAIAEEFSVVPTCALLINGNAFADALAAARFSAVSTCPIMLTNRDNVPAATDSWLEANNGSMVAVAAIGGTGVITNDTLFLAASAATP